MGKFCKKCGKELREGAAFCPACGYPVKGKSTRTKKSRLRPVYIAVGIVIAIVMIVAALGFCHYRREKLYKETVAIGDSYMKKAQYDKAEEAYQKAEKIKETDPMLYVKLGDLYLQQWSGSPAEWYRKALELDPGLIEAYKGLARLYWEFTDKKEFRNIVEEAQGALEDESKEFFSYIEILYEDYMRYAEYYDVYESQSKNGGGMTYTGTYVQTYGFCFAKLIDFDGDGTEELVMVYTESEYDSPVRGGATSFFVDDYVLEVWNYNGGEAKQIFHGTPKSEYGGDRIVFLADGEKNYLKVGDETGELGCYIYQNGEFQRADDKNGDVKSYLLQGNELNGQVKEYRAWDEWRRTEKKIEYKKTAASHAIQLALRGVDEKIIETNIIGNYKYESEDKSMYVCGYIDMLNEPKLFLAYWTRQEDGYLRFKHDEAGYTLDDNYSGTEQLIAVAEKGDTLSISLEARTEDKVIRAELARETQYDSTEVKNYRNKQRKEEQETHNSFQEGDNEGNTYQLNEESIGCAVQKFLDEKEFETLDSSANYYAGDSESVSRYAEAYWVPIYKQDDLDNAVYYAIVASAAFEEPGAAYIYPAEVRDVITGNKSMKDFTAIESFDAKKYIDV